MQHDPGASTFVLSGGQTSPAEMGFLGLWSVPPEAPPGAVAFDLEGEPSPPADVSLWRCEIPADTRQARQNLSQAQDNLDTSQAALEKAQQRFAALYTPSGAGVSFDTLTPSPALPAAEGQALALAAYAQAAAGAAPALSFGLGEDIAAQWQAANQQFQGFLNRLEGIVGHFAWVETRLQGQLLARTTVSWLGDLETHWFVQPDADQIQLHERTVKLSLTSRTAMLRTFVVVSTGAVKLTTLLATPSGAILALPAAWNFINQVHAELAQRPDSS